MRRRIIILLLLVASVLMLGGSAPALAGGPRKITGGVRFTFFEVPLFEYWGEMNLHEVTPQIGEANAEGMWNWREYNDMEDFGWRRIWGHPVCVAFGQDVGEDPQTAVVVVQIDRIRGWWWDWEDVGAHWKLWLRDGGTPASDGDQIGIVAIFPVGEAPTCEYQDPLLGGPFPLEEGNLAIHTYD